jgi:hypothetical protein
MHDSEYGPSTRFDRPIRQQRLANKEPTHDGRECRSEGRLALLHGARFKVPSLRNVELTGPFFHNGGLLTLRQVVDFYNPGSDFPTEELTDSQIRPLGPSDRQENALVAFMLALTDERVRSQSAPFDHPEHCVANGELGNAAQVTAAGASLEAADNVTCLAASGAAGGVTAALAFLGASQFSR